ncbi:hypothetical protein [Campylobacter sp.]|uniref:hypothetical protein n=1 Tax=Campylobacter sp. TaxID=205 RepID=UPI00259CBCC9|nr:hypothetical protein [Campylobacter sp.]MBQ7134741.1 hypothetical protein [Campylobacter sp.]
MGTRKFEKLILSSAKSKDDIVAEALAQISKYEAKDPANDYVCSVIHAYDDGDNAGDQYIVINEKLRVEYGLKGNAVASSHYSRADIKAMIDAVDAKIPLDPAKEALLKEVEAIEADIRAKEAQLPPKEKELRNLKQQKATIEQEIADLNSLIAEARAEGRSTTVLEASKAQREADLAAKNREISTLEGEINEIKRQIPLLQEQAKNKQTQQESIKSPELATKVYVDELKASLDSDIATKANQDTTYTKTEVDNIANTKANQDTTYTKTEVDDIANTKANANAVVNLTGNQTINDIKTFSIPPVSATNPTQINQVANKAYVDSVGNAKVALTGDQTIAGNKTFSETTTLNGAMVSKGANTFSGNNTFNTGQVTFNNKAPICAVAPAADTNLVNRAYSKKRGGYVAVTGGAINLNNGINFSLNLTSKVNITVSNAASNIGQTGEIFVARGANISSFKAPFNFRIAQSGFGDNEVFSYTVVSSSLVRIVRS